MRAIATNPADMRVLKRYGRRGTVDSETIVIPHLEPGRHKTFSVV